MPERGLTEQEKKAVMLLKLAAVSKKDFWTFLRYFVRTHDEHDPTVESKLFPSDKVCYRILCRAVEENSVLFLEKSRQVMVTWFFVAYCLHDILFKKNRRVAFQSTKDETAKALVRRAQFIYSHIYNSNFPDIPEPGWSKGGRVGTDSYLEIPSNNSIIQAVAQGGEVFTSYTFSIVFADEVSKQTEAEEGHRCAMPTLAGGGKYMGPASSYGRVFNWRKLYGIDKNTGRQRGKRLIDSYDITQKRFTEEQLLRMPKSEFDAIPLEVVCACVPGMRYWVMELDGEVTPCLRFHYSADPGKRRGTVEGDAWYRSERPKYSKSQWDREMEIQYDTFSGRPVINNWSRDAFVTEEIEFQPDEKLHIPIDFGRVAGALFSQKIRLEKYNFQQAWILMEKILRGSTTFMLADAIVDILKQYFPEAWRYGNFCCYPDPSGHKTTATTANSSLNTDIKILQSRGLKVYTRKFGIAESSRFVEDIFARSSPDGDPGVLVHPRCPYIISCYEGGWHYPDRPIGQGLEIPEKDGEYDHGGDMTRYGFSNMFDIKELTGEREERMPTVVPIRQRHTARIIGYRAVGNSRRRPNLARGIH